jgi:anthranilate/para-aminobenzoate synthase component I
VLQWGIVFGSKQSQALLSAHKLNYQKVPFNQSPLEIFSKIQKRYETAYLLESIEGPRKLAQYSFIGFAPRLTIEIKKGSADMSLKNS